MLIEIDMTSEKPIYEQIKASIIGGILKGELVEGSKLPSSRVLASNLGINMHTVGKAYNLLKDGGFVSVLRSKGVVINPLQMYQADKAYLDELTNMMNSIVAEAKCRGLSKERLVDVITTVYDHC